MAPPDLSQTKLHFVQGHDYSGLSNTLQMLHGGIRNIAKVMLHLYETQGTAEKEMNAFVPFKLREKAGDDGDTVKAKEFRTPAIDEVKKGVTDEDIQKMVSENSPEVLARSYVAYKRYLKIKT